LITSATRQEDPRLSHSPRRLRIAYVVHDYNRQYGHSRYVVELASRFKKDHDVHVFANTMNDLDPSSLTIHHVPASRLNVMTTLVSFLLPATWMTTGRFDIIHAQGVCGLRQNVVTAHICQGAWLDAMTQYSGRPSWRKRLFHSLAGWLEQRTFAAGNSRQVIAVSHRIACDLQRYYGRSKDVCVIHHGVDSETFHPGNRARWRRECRRNIGVEEDTPLVLYVGDYQKGLAPTIQAVARVPRLHLLGVARSPAAPYIDLIRSENVTDRMHLVPATQNVEKYYAAADLFIFPTFYDPFGMVATEAMASGLPVICSSRAGVAELITDGEDGLVVSEPWNPSALAGALAKLTADRSLRQRLGEAARRKAETLTWDNVARQTMEVYRHVTG
jgi:UDP-glucose:(heptosyl)LPS alpha-1,3-glucosyltransferase